MRTRLIPRIRELLRTNPDGMTAPAIRALTQASEKGVWEALNNMPDAYRDRWVKSAKGPYVAIWCVVVPPPHCPHPNKEK